MTTDGGYSVDTGYYTFPARLFKASMISTFTVAASDYTAGAYPVKYIFTVIPVRRVTEGAYLKLEMPAETSVTDRGEMTRRCPRESVSGFSNYYISCTHDPNNNIITVKDGFKYSESKGDPPTLIFTIPNLKNPRSLRSSGYFNITVYDSSGEALYYFN